MMLCTLLAPDIATISPSRYSCFVTALRSQLIYSPGVRYVRAIGVDMCASSVLYSQKFVNQIARPHYSFFANSMPTRNTTGR